jgi:1-pyrroline-5-carboxylate dehydrogenase
MLSATARVPAPVNEPVLTYAPGSHERAVLERTLAEMSAREVDLPMVIGGREVRTGLAARASMPHRHAHTLGHYHKGGAAEIAAALAAAKGARGDWARAPQTTRAAVFLKAAELLAGKYRATLNAATMLGQSKTAHQAEIDSACELIDFWRFNVAFAAELGAMQPLSSPGVWNLTDVRPLEGFVFAVTPFNFTAIAGNLPTAPALMGCTVVWKPAASASYSAHFIMEILREAGLPPGVINLVHGDPREISAAVLESRDLGGVHFTGSTGVFNQMWATIGANVARYQGYPRIVGETGGKDFILAHASADVDALAVAIARGGYEYQGQKCSAASRIYVPDTMWPKLRERLLGILSELRVGDVSDFKNFMGAVIDQAAYQKISSYLAFAKSSPSAKVLHGGEGDDRQGWFIQPTLVEVTDPKHKLMVEEIFGPVVTLYVYPEGDFEGALRLVDESTPYALTGSIFAQDRAMVDRASAALRHAAGNFYINDKPTGAVVGQQPFGGARASGTNDKAGSLWNLMRWVSPRTIKETFAPPTDWRYPFLG